MQCKKASATQHYHSLLSHGGLVLCSSPGLPRYHSGTHTYKVTQSEPNACWIYHSYCSYGSWFSLWMHLSFHLGLEFSLLDGHLGSIQLSWGKSVQALYAYKLHVADACRRVFQTSGSWVVRSVLQGEVCVCWNAKGLAQCLISSWTKCMKNERSCQEQNQTHSSFILRETGS